ncbi:hypothetical protein BD413DRAFT_602474 [Trametes elegans]|nr:hypothetical protein BD413DRAFT_602474 [Trametes elegans]
MTCPRQRRPRSGANGAWKRWARERDAHRAELAEWQREREEVAAHRREVVRRSQGVYWTEPHADAHCHAWGTRAHYAQLRDVPTDLNWLEVCDNMPPVNIHGHNLSKPDRCERRGNDDILGVWYVDFHEPGCAPYWDSLSDKGCTPGNDGFRRYESRLEGIGRGEDWERMCATAPATIGGVHYAQPTSCENRGWLGGMVGVWDHLDRSCTPWRWV